MHNAPLPSPLLEDFQSRRHHDRSRLAPDLNSFLLCHSDLRRSFPRISRMLHRVLAHQHAELTLYDPESNHLRLLRAIQFFGNGAA